MFTGQLSKYEYVAISRKSVSIPEVEWRRGPVLSRFANWKPLLSKIDCVVHLAGRVHLSDQENSAAYIEENCNGTLKLAQDAVEAGVQKFIFISSAKVIGEETHAPLDEAAPACPSDPYALSKYTAEKALSALKGDIALTILRPPLVYGPEVRANFLALLSAIAVGVPFPLASVRNRRSFICVHNLVSAILACIESPNAAGRIFNVTDGKSASTPELIRLIAKELGQPSRLFAFPPFLLEKFGEFLGRGETIKRLTRSLELDDSSIRRELGWREVRTLEEGIAETAQWYLGRPDSG